MRIPNVKSYLRNLLSSILLRFRFFRLALRNLFTSSTILEPTGPTLSLTTHGRRLKDVHIVIETIGKGRVLPSRFMLFLDVEEDVLHPNKPLKRLQKRGLEIHLSENLGPHTKIQWWIRNAPDFSRPHIIVDDDIFYPVWWLERMMESSQREPTSIMAYRAHRIVLTDDRKGLMPYDTWPAGIKEPNHLNFATGCSGILFPPNFLEVLREAGDGFQDTCPRADDIWHAFLSIENGVGIGLVTDESIHFDTIPGSQEQALHLTNVSEQQNDVQLRQTFRSSTYEKLAEQEFMLQQR